MSTAAPVSKRKGNWCWTSKNSGASVDAALWLTDWPTPLDAGDGGIDTAVRYSSSFASPHGVTRKIGILSATRVPSPIPDDADSVDPLRNVDRLASVAVYT